MRSVHGYFRAFCHVDQMVLQPDCSGGLAVNRQAVNKQPGERSLQAGHGSCNLEAKQGYMRTFLKGLATLPWMNETSSPNIAGTLGAVSNLEVDASRVPQQDMLGTCQNVVAHQGGINLLNYQEEARGNSTVSLTWMTSVRLWLASQASGLSPARHLACYCSKGWNRKHLSETRYARG